MNKNLQTDQRQSQVQKHPYSRFTATIVISFPLGDGFIHVNAEDVIARVPDYQDIAGRSTGNTIVVHQAVERGERSAMLIKGDYSRLALIVPLRTLTEQLPNVREPLAWW